MHILCVNALKLLSGFLRTRSGFGTRFGTRSGFSGEDRSATLLQTGKAANMSELQAHH